MTDKTTQEAECLSRLTAELGTDDMTEISLGMSNFDMSIDEGFEDALRKDEGKVFGRHAGWNFNGRVYFLNGLFYEEVWRYGGIIETLSSENLKELMIDVCENYGYD
jgi:hypothetical protein